MIQLPINISVSKSRFSRRYHLQVFVNRVLFQVRGCCSSCASANGYFVESAPISCYLERFHKYLMHVYLVVNGNQSISKGTLHQLFTKSLWRSERCYRPSLCSFYNLTACHFVLTYNHTFLLFFLANVDGILSPTAVIEKVKLLFLLTARKSLLLVRRCAAKIF